MKSKQGDNQSDNKSPSAWQQLAALELLPAADVEQQVKCQIARAVRDLALPAATVARLNSAVAEAVGNAMQQGQDQEGKPAILLNINLCLAKINLSYRAADDRRALTALPLRGWGFFLVERLAAGANIRNDSQHIVELYLYQEGEL